MLYELHELQRATWSPVTFWAQAGAGLFSNPFSAFSYAPLSRNLAAGYELLARLGQLYFGGLQAPA